MGAIPVTMIVVYMVIVTIVGSLLATRSRSAREWALAGGGMGTIMLAFGIAGTRIGGAGTYGVAGDVINGGVWNLWWYGINTFLAMALVALFYAVPFRRLQLHTVSEVFRQRFGSERCVALTSLCVQTEYLIVDVIEAFLIGAILDALTPLPFTVTVFIAAAILITYTALGGLWGSAVTNLIHCAVILSGLLAVGWLGVRELGGWEKVVEGVNGRLAEDGKEAAAWWSFIGAGWGGVIGMFFSATIHTPAASIYVNFAGAARSERAIIPAFFVGGAIGALMPVLAGWIGVQTLARYGAHAGLSSYRYITQLAADINPWIGGVALAAVLAAIISSGGPILLASATLFVQDWLRFTRDYDPIRKLRAFRIATVVYGLVAAVIALLIRDFRISVLDLLLFGFAMVCPPAIAVGFVFYWKRTTEAGAFWGMLLGYVVGLVWFVLIKQALRIEFEAGEDAAWPARVFAYLFTFQGRGIDPSYPTTLLPLLLVPLISLLSRQETTRRADFYERLARPGS